MHILTCGNRRFREMIQLSMRQAELLGYRFSVYDLGGLGFGQPFEFDAGRFLAQPANRADHLRLPHWVQRLWTTRKTGPPLVADTATSPVLHDGYYFELEKGRFTRALHKPALIQQVLADSSQPLVYLDGDAILLSQIDDICWPDFDIGLVMRHDGDLSWSPHTSTPINAGVMFFAATDAARSFVEQWAAETAAARNDQVAIGNLLALPHSGWVAARSRWFRKRKTRYVFDSSRLPPRVTRRGVRVQLFDYRYNCFTTPIPPDARIVHFKGPANKLRFDEFRMLCERWNYVAA